jgi:hypothetical protein
VTVPPCTRLGSQCRRLPAVLRVSSWDKKRSEADHEATWLMGHTQRIAFGETWTKGKDLFVDVVIHVPCKHLEETDRGTARCAVHGFRGTVPTDTGPRDQPRQLGDDRFAVVDNGRLRPYLMPKAKRPLRVLGQAANNPCDGAPCRTSDHTRGAACCRDLQIEIMCKRTEQKREALLRARQAPYLCKVEREGDESVNAEVISACTYIDEADGVSCTLHGRRRPDGRTSKPTLCSVWPGDVEKGETLHTGCVFKPGHSTV